VQIPPAVETPPLSQSAAEGGQATFCLMISGHPPPFGYILRKSSVFVTNYASANSAGFLSLYNLAPSQAGTYRIIVTNAANPDPGLSLGPVTLTVLADTDRDGLPDEWEVDNNLDPSDADDARLDPDFDGQSSLDEFTAGTDPHDPDSLLRITRIRLAEDAAAALIEFQAAANKTYTLQSRNHPDSGPWNRLADFIAFPSPRTVSLTQALDGTAERYYRLATPRAP
jgi:hypothetical protein